MTTENLNKVKEMVKELSKMGKSNHHIKEAEAILAWVVDAVGGKLDKPDRTDVKPKKLMTR